MLPSNSRNIVHAGYVRLGMKARLIAVLVGLVFLAILGFAAFAMWMNRPSRIMDATP